MYAKSGLPSCGFTQFMFEVMNPPASFPTFLATTAIREFWDPHRPMLLLGEWCGRHQELKHGEFSIYGILENPWDDPQKLGHAARYCSERFDAVLASLAGFFNRAHGEQHSARYWQIIVGPWLFHTLEALYDRYATLRAAFARYPGLETVTLAPESYVTPANWYEYTYLMVGDAYNLQLYSQILSIMGKRFSSRPYRVVPLLPHPDSALTRHLRVMAKRIYAMFLESVGAGRPILFFDMHMSRLDVWRLCASLRFRAWPMEKRLFDAGRMPINNAAREQLRNLPVDRLDNFTRCFLELLPILLPTAYLEGYVFLRNQTASVRRRGHQVLVSALGWKSNEYFKFIAADTAERGATLIGVQHGGSSGIMANSPMDRHIMSVSDSYVSWGWKGISGTSVVSLPNPAMVRLAQMSPLSKASTRLFVGTNFPRYVVSFRSQPQGSQMRRYFDWQIAFFQALPKSVRTSFTVRLSPHDLGWNNYARLENGVGPLRLDDMSIPYRRRLKQAQLVVVDNCQTTFLEAIVRNRPVVLFYEPELWGMAQESEQLLGRLREVQILHHDPVAAAVHTAAIFHNPQLWWERAEVQEARKAFVDAFVAQQADWVSAWRNHFSAVLAQSAGRTKLVSTEAKS